MITSIAQQIGYLASSSGDSNSSGAIVIIALLAGGGLYFLVWNYYRNANARFKFEDNTIAQASNVEGTDTRVNHRRGLRSSNIDGRNDNDATARIPIEKLWPTPPGAIQSVLDEATGNNQPPTGGATPPAVPPQQSPQQQPQQPQQPPYQPPQQSQPPYQPPPAG